MLIANNIKIAVTATFAGLLHRGEANYLAGTMGRLSAIAKNLPKMVFASELKKTSTSPLVTSSQDNVFISPAAPRAPGKGRSGGKTKKSFSFFHDDNTESGAASSAAASKSTGTPPIPPSAPRAPGRSGGKKKTNDQRLPPRPPAPKLSLPGRSSGKVKHKRRPFFPDDDGDDGKDGKARRLQAVAEEARLQQRRDLGADIGAHEAVPVLAPSPPSAPRRRVGNNGKGARRSFFPDDNDKDDAPVLQLSKPTKRKVPRT